MQVTGTQIGGRSQIGNRAARHAAHFGCQPSLWSRRFQLWSSAFLWEPPLTLGHQPPSGAADNLPRWSDFFGSSRSPAPPTRSWWSRRPTSSARIVYPVVMPLKVITEEQAAAGLASLTEELAFLLESKRVDKQTRALLGHLGMDTVEVFAHSFQGVDDLRKALKKDFELDIDDSLADKRVAALLIGVWQAAAKRLSQRDEAEAVARVEGRPLELGKMDHLSLRRAHEREHGKVQDSIFPSQDYNNSRIAQVEEGDFRAEPLSQVVSVSASGDESGDLDQEAVLQLMKTGVVRTSRVRVRVPMPKNVEELRKRYETMVVHWQLMKMRFPERPAFAHLAEETWTKVLNYLWGRPCTRTRRPITSACPSSTSWRTSMRLGSTHSARRRWTAPRCTRR